MELDMAVGFVVDKLVDSKLVVDTTGTLHKSFFLIFGYLQFIE